MIHLARHPETALLVLACSFSAACQRPDAMPAPPSDSFTIDSVGWIMPTGTTVQLVRARVTHDFVAAGRVDPAIGRFFHADDFRGATPVAVLAWQLWQERLGGDPTIIGKPIALDGDSSIVIGVMPESYRNPGGAQVWTPVTSVSR
jgi:hypothetical protein